MWNRRFACLLATLIAIRILFIAFAPLDLSPDEAYYWDWSRHLGWGYYSKPPLIAWVIALGTSIFGNSAMGVRLPAAILATLSAFPIYLLGRRIFGTKAGFIAALSTALMPGSCILAFAMTIDAPLIFFWAWAMYVTWLALDKKDEYQGKTAGLWIASGILTGLGILSKQTMMAFPPFVFLFLILDPAYKKKLFTPWPYLALIISLILLGPVLWWNHKHGWITLEHTAHHFEPGARSFFIFLRTLPEFILSQMGIISPIIWILSVIISCYILFAAIRRYFLKKNGEFLIQPQALYLAMLSAVPIALTMLLSLKQRVNGNWPAPFYLASSVVLGGWAAGALNLTPGIDRLRRTFKPGLILSTFMCAILYITSWSAGAGILGLDQGHMDFTAGLKGWKELGEITGEFTKNLQDKGAFIIGTKRQITSELAFYVPGQPKTYRWAGEHGEIKSQYEIWQGPCDKIGHDAIIITYEDEKLPEDIKGYFKEIDMVKQIKTGRKGFNLYLGRDLMNWPGCSAQEAQGQGQQPSPLPQADQAVQ
ncbi:MAG: ArnT family glycosyltransferase [Dissulfurimicrobium sp.]|uniref:ArnT family glycosyltransferase n=1 Tax=Dissulfurimicrobium sp. TaxID=2022436 RepID=UPI00404AE2AD